MDHATSRPLTRLLLPLAFLGAALLAWLQWRGVTGGIWVDSDVYVMGARNLLDGGDLYADATPVDLRFTYPPFAAAMFVPLALMPVGVARALLTALSLAALLVTVTIVGRRLALKPWGMAWLVVAAAALEPVLRNLLLGQVNLVLMALIVVDLLVVPQRFRGLLVGVAAGIKLTPAVFILYFLLQKDWRSAARVAAGFAATVVVGWLAAPSSSASFWGGGFIGLGKFGPDAVVGTDNQSLLAASLRLLGRPELPLMALATLAIAGVGLGALAARRALERGGEAATTEAMVWIAFGGLLGSPVSWTHHWVWALFAIAVFAARSQPVRAGLLLFAFWFPTVWIFYTENDFEELTFPWWKSMATAIYVLVGLGVLLLEATRTPKSAPPGQAVEPASPPHTAQHAPSST